MPLDVDDVVARHHHLAHGGVAELEDGVDHLALAGLDERRGLGQVDQLAQLGLGGERALAEAAARGERVAEQDQQPRQRAQHRVTQRQRAPPRPAPPARSAGAPGCAGATPIATNESTSITAMASTRRAARSPSTSSSTSRVTMTIAEISHSSRRNSAVLRNGSGSLEQRDQAPAARAALGDQLLGAGPGERRQRGVGGREQPGQQDQRRGQDEQPHVAAAHLRAPSRRRHPSPSLLAVGRGAVGRALVRAGCARSSGQGARATPPAAGPGGRTSRGAPRARRGRSRAGAGCRAR